MKLKRKTAKCLFLIENHLKGIEHHLQSQGVIPDFVFQVYVTCP